VMFCDEFCKSLARIKSEVTRKDVVSLLVKLSNGWRNPSQEPRKLSFMDGTSSQLLEQYEVPDLLNLLWTVDIMKEDSKMIQVLKFWDILPSSDVPNLCKRLDAIVESYTVYRMNYCKYKCLDGKLEVPMSWEVTPGDAVKLENVHNNEHERLSTGFASLRLNGSPSRPANFSRKLEVPMSWEVTPGDAVKLENVHNNEHERLSTGFASLRLNGSPSRPANFSRSQGRGRRSSSRSGRVG
ncbi:P-loop containing nucleoside triphosphate hydrolases superfamily protein, partial [Thalictrum thalictroides]